MPLAVRPASRKKKRIQGSNGPSSSFGYLSSQMNSSGNSAPHLPIFQLLREGRGTAGLEKEHEKHGCSNGSCLFACCSGTRLTAVSHCPDSCGANLHRRAAPGLGGGLGVVLCLAFPIAFCFLHFSLFFHDCILGSHLLRNMWSVKEAVTIPPPALYDCPM